MSELVTHAVWQKTHSDLEKPIHVGLEDIESVSSESDDEDFTTQDTQANNKFSSLKISKDKCSPFAAVRQRSNTIRQEVTSSCTLDDDLDLLQFAIQCRNNSSLLDE